VRRALWIFTGVLGLLALLATAGVFTSIWTSLFDSSMNEQQSAALASNIANIKLGFWIAFIVALAVTGAIEGYLRGMWSARGALIVLCVVAFVEQYRVDWPFLHGTRLMNDASDPTLFAPDESIQFLQQRQAAGEVFRAFDLSAIVPQLQGQGYGSNTLAIHGIEQLAGHHGNEMGRYRELIGGPEPLNLGKNLSLLDLTNTQYVLSPQPLELPGYTEVYRGSRSVVLRKADVLPRAYLVGRVEVVPDAQAVTRLLAKDFDYRSTAILPSGLPAGTQVQPNPQGSVQWVHRTANRQTLRVRTDRPALLMLLDNYYKSWHVHVDHRTAPLLRANYTFRAVPLSAGEHEVTFMYLPYALHTPAMISALTLIVLLLIAFGSPVVDRLRARRAVAA
jgi:hypothetical protein